jgi:hypothetical protein
LKTPPKFLEKGILLPEYHGQLVICMLSNDKQIKIYDSLNQRIDVNLWRISDCRTLSEYCTLSLHDGKTTPDKMNAFLENIL